VFSVIDLCGVFVSRATECLCIFVCVCVGVSECGQVEQ
jgi:hypothetical protein